MLFGRRKQVVKRILIVEDEPLTAFDNENMLGDAGYVIVATVDDLDESLRARFRAIAIPQPVGVTKDRQVLSDDRADVPGAAGHEKAHGQRG